MLVNLSQAKNQINKGGNDWGISNRTNMRNTNMYITCTTYYQYFEIKSIFIWSLVL